MKLQQAKMFSEEPFILCINIFLLVCVCVCVCISVYACVCDYFRGPLKIEKLSVNIPVYTTTFA